MEEMILNETVDLADDFEETTVGSVYESIETNLWLADSYFAQGAAGLGMECLRSAWSEYVRFRDILHVYEAGAGTGLGERLVQALVQRAGDSAASLALGPSPDGQRLWETLAAA